MTICPEPKNLAEKGQQCQAHMTTSARSPVAGDIKSPQTGALRVKWHQAVRRAEEVQMLRNVAI
jgi:hypothetical protein